VEVTPSKRQVNIGAINQGALSGVILVLLCYCFCYIIVFYHF
jgi:hypothetical protein